MNFLRPSYILSINILFYSRFLYQKKKSLIFLLLHSLTTYVSIKIGSSSSYPLSAVEQPSPYFVYGATSTISRRSISSGQFPRALDCVGRVSHVLTVDNHEISPRRQAQDVASKDPISRTTLLSTPSPRLVPSSPLLSGVHVGKNRALAPSSPKPTNTFRSLTMRLIHLLAVEQPARIDRLAGRTKANIDEVRSLLTEYAQPAPSDPQAFILTDLAYKELRIWEWKGYTAGQRDKIIEDASKAFERLALPKDDMAWKMLIEPRLRTSSVASTSSVSSNASTSSIASSSSSVSSVSDDSSTTSSNTSENSVPALRLDDGPLPVAAPPVVAETPDTANTNGHSSTSISGVKRVGGAILKTKPLKRQKLESKESKESKDPREKKEKKEADGVRNISNSRVTGVSNGGSASASSSINANHRKQSSISAGSASTSEGAQSALKKDNSVKIKKVRRPDQTTQSSGTDNANGTKRKATSLTNSGTSSSTGSSRVRSSSGGGSMSPRKPSPLGASPPVNATDLSHDHGHDHDRKEDDYKNSNGSNNNGKKTSASQLNQADLLRLARRFREQYEEYRKLYAEVRQYETQKSLNPKHEVAYHRRREQLLSLHSKLESWKSELWRAAPRFTTSS
ncbi:hypothetical protein V1511DRAFT_415274 [Dipodascopsis uninucleata]